MKTTNSIAELERRKAEILSSIANAKKRHEEELIGFGSELRQTQEGIEVRLAGLDPEIILHAEHVIYVRGSYAKAGEDRAPQREAAIQDLLKGAPQMHREYFGTKSYDRWHGQACDCSYGMGPRHGSIIFEIGLTREARTRDLTEEEINAAVYYLRSLEKIQTAKQAAIPA